MFAVKIARAVLLALSLTCSAHARTTYHFKSYYRSMEWIDKVVHGRCQPQYDYYIGITDDPGNYSIPAGQPQDTHWYTDPLVDCVLGYMSDSYKANMAGAAVMLGLIPTALAFTASGTIEMGLLCLKRPIFATLLSFSSPAIEPIHTFEFRDPIEYIKRAPDFPRPQSALATILIILAEYILLLLALVNTAETTWELSLRVVFSFSAETAFAPAVYVVSTAVVHAVGAFALRSRLRFVPIEYQTRSIGERLKDDFVPCSLHSRGTFESKKPKAWKSVTGILFWLLPWLVSVLIVLLIMYGTFIFSSVIFIDGKSSLYVAGRYMASVVVCRMILVFELSGMKQDLPATQKSAPPLYRKDSNYDPGAFNLSRIDSGDNESTEVLLPPASRLRTSTNASIMHRLDEAR